MLYEERITHQFDSDELEEELDILQRMRRHQTIDASVLTDNDDSYEGRPLSGRITIVPR